MDQTGGSTSFTLFGIRVDCAPPVHTTATLWESAISRGGIRAVLADLWTLLMAQRDFAMWEALSAAEFVLPLGDDPIIRRAAARQRLPVTRADGLLFDLFDAAASSRKRVVIVAPSAELAANLALIRQVWPELQVTGQVAGEADDPVGDRELVRAVNAVGPELLVMGGGSPWQEGWSHAHRDDLEIGAAVLLPTLHPALAAIAQRAGKPVAGVGLLRRKAAIRRAFSTTLGPMASASAETVGAWLHEAREGLADWSASLQAQRRTSLPQQPALPAPGHRSVGARARMGRAANESSGRWVGISPLARLGPPRQTVGLPAASLGDAPASATQQTPSGAPARHGRGPEQQAAQTPEQTLAASGPSVPSSAADTSGAMYGRRVHQVGPDEPLATPDAGPASSVPDDRQYWVEQPTTALTVDQLSAASREMPRHAAAPMSMDGNDVHPSASRHAAGEASTLAEDGDRSPPRSDPDDDERMLVFEPHSPVDWTAFLAAEETYDELPPTTKLDPRVALESSRGVPGRAQFRGDLAPTQQLRSPEPGEPGEPGAPFVASAETIRPAQARQEPGVTAEDVFAAAEDYEVDRTDDGEHDGGHEVVEFAPAGGPTAQMPAETSVEPVVDAGAAANDPARRHDGARDEGSREETNGSAQAEPVRARIITRYVVRRSRRRFMRARRYHRSLKPRQQGTQG